MNQLAEHGDGIGGNGDQDGGIYAFNDIIGHRKKSCGWEVKVKWASGEETWEPLVVIFKADPITITKYAIDNCLLEKPGWKRCKPYVKINQNAARINFAI